MSRPSSSEPLSGLSLLLVDDDELVRCALVCLLRRRGARVRSFAAAEPALQAALEERPDLVVIDLELPVMTGFEAASALADEPLTADVPVLAFSGHTDARTRKAALAAGAHAFLAKPCDMEELVSAVASLTRGVRAERALQASAPAMAGSGGRSTSPAACTVERGPARSPLAALLAELARTRVSRGA